MLNFNFFLMTQIHVVIRRVNPALKVDLVQVGYIKDGHFSTLPLDALERTPVSDHVRCCDMSDSPCIAHDSIRSLIEALIAYPGFAIEFFDNTLVLMFDFDLTHDESPSKEEGKGH